MKIKKSHKIPFMFYFSDDPKDPGPFSIEWILKPLFLKKVLNNMYEMENYLIAECQDINYTVVRPAGLANGDMTGNQSINQSIS